jgi:gliding motility-associated-like protein
LTKNFASNAAVGIYSYRLSAAEAGNLSSTKCRVVSQSLTIRIVANPVTSVTANSPLCEGKTVNLQATGGSTYQWNGVNGFSATGSNVTIQNSQASQSGKYYLTAISAEGCVHRDSITITINPNPVASTPFSIAKICQGDDLQLTAGGGGTYQWIPAAGLSSDIIANPIASPSDTTQYMVVVTNTFDCTDTAQVLVNVVEAPHADAGPDRTIIKDNSTQLTGSVSGQNVSFSWSPVSNMTNDQTLQPIVTPPSDIDYVLTVTSNEGCGISTDTAHVFVYADVFIPTAFSPNGDGKNDTWYVPVLNAFSVFEVSVFNRYGQLVFHTRNANQPWDGKYRGSSLPVGVYVYMISIKDVKRLFKGTLTLVR